MDARAMDWIDVSPEMISLVGAGPLPDAPWPAAPAAFVIDVAAAHFRYHARPTAALLDADGDQPRIVLIVSHAACRRILGRPPSMDDGDRFHLPAPLRAIALALRDCALHEAARTPYRLAKSIELLCETLHLDGAGELVPVDAEGSLSHADSQRLLAARRVIEERWAEKLTLDSIARACGLNRAKLTRGFRELFECSVADAIAAQRLRQARQMLLATDLPVASIGYRCGYLNNASFARAFARHFGVAPTQYRARRLAA